MKGCDSCETTAAIIWYNVARSRLEEDSARQLNVHVLWTSTTLVVWRAYIHHGDGKRFSVCWSSQNKRWILSLVVLSPKARASLPSRDGFTCPLYPYLFYHLIEPFINQGMDIRYGYSTYITVTILTMTNRTNHKNPAQYSLFENISSCFPQGDHLHFTRKSIALHTTPSQMKIHICKLERISWSSENPKLSFFCIWTSMRIKKKSWVVVWPVGIHVTQVSVLVVAWRLKTLESFLDTFWSVLLAKRRPMLWTYTPSLWQQIAVWFCVSKSW